MYWSAVVFAFWRVLVEVEGAIIRWEVFIMAPIITVMGLTVLIMLSVPWVKGWRLLKVQLITVIGARRFNYIISTGRRFDGF